jgi:alpha-glucosidase (family GH31 glycosyl hydrolase)
MLMAYVSHDIGSFHAKHLSDELYVRWIQLGTFQPIMRLHSNHGDRLPWQYSDEARRAAERFLRIRQRLSAYIYTAARQSHDTALPITRALYLDHPTLAEAYSYTTEYMFGDALLVAPIVTAAPDATSAWLPDGLWYQLFTDQRFVGDKVYRLQYGLNEMPLFARAGSIIPLVPDDDHVGVAAPETIAWHVYPGANGNYSLYDDAGEGLGYTTGEFAFTEVSYEDSPKPKLTINPPVGSFGERLVNRVYTVVFHDVNPPAQVKRDGHKIAQWSYDEATRQLSVFIGRGHADRPLTVEPQLHAR